MALMLLLISSFVLSSIVTGARGTPVASKPNIVMFLTDDQDQILGGSFPRAAADGATPMPKTKLLMEDGGAMAMNFHIHTPICNPSRSELLSGRYFHNIKTVGGPLWSMHVNEARVNTATFAMNLKQAGFTVGMFGKCKCQSDGAHRTANILTNAGCDVDQNTMPMSVPTGFDAWLGNPGGDYVAPLFQSAGLDWAGVTPGESSCMGGGVPCWQGTADNYTTAVVGNISIAWIKKVVQEAPTRPFFAYVGER